MPSSVVSNVDLFCGFVLAVDQCWNTTKLILEGAAESGGQEGIDWIS